MARPLLLIASKDVSALEELIQRLNQEKPLTESDVYHLRATHRFPQNTLSRLFGREDPKGYIRSIQDNLGEMVAVVDGILDDWFATGALMAPFYARRIGIILGKAKMPDLRAKFDAANQRHQEPERPPHDVEMNRIKLNILQGAVPRLKVSIKNIEVAGGKGLVYFEFCCEDCGGFVLTSPDGDDPQELVSCKACGEIFGIHQHIVDLARHIGEMAGIRCTGVMRSEG